uniref:Uncharacterized protein n=1 Tax=Tetranychus urticae TaxID=32264 RepID=T1K918_TETUR
MAFNLALRKIPLTFKDSANGLQMSVRGQIMSLRIFPSHCKVLSVPNVIIKDVPNSNPAYKTFFGVAEKIGSGWLD